MIVNAGTQVRLRGTFRDVDGALVDPPQVDWIVVKPDGTRETVAGARLSLGVYEALITHTAPGCYTHQCNGVAILSDPLEIWAREAL